MADGSFSDFWGGDGSSFDFSGGGGGGDTSGSLNSGVFGDMQDFGGIGNPVSPSDPSNPDPYVDTNPGVFDPSTVPGMGGGNPLAGLGNGAGLMTMLPGLIQALGGMAGFSTSKEGIDMTKDMISKADPWGSSGGRMMADQQLMSMMGSGPPKASDVPNLPGYQSGLEAVERSGAANGYLGSGNMMASMMQYGGQQYQQAFQNWDTQFKDLAGVGGTNVQPGGNNAQLMGILGQAEASKNASLMNGVSGIAGAMSNVMKPQQGGGGSSGGGGGGGLGDLGGIASLAMAFL